MKNLRRTHPLRRAAVPLARVAAQGALAALGLLAGCNHVPISEHHPLSVRAADKRVEDIPAAQVTGTLRGEAFTLGDARVRVETIPGRERIDLWLAEREIERCGVPAAGGGRRVWLRLPGRPTLDGAPLRVEAGGTGPLTVHYELPVESQWLGHGGGAALVSLSSQNFGEVAGRLWVCFDDGKESCVAGAFQALPCASELDVDDSVWGSAALDSQYATKRGE